MFRRNCLFFFEDVQALPFAPRCQLYEIHLALKATLDAGRVSGRVSRGETCDEAFRDDLYGKYELEDTCKLGQRAPRMLKRSQKCKGVFNKNCQESHANCQEMSRGRLSDHVSEDAAVQSLKAHYRKQRGGKYRAWAVWIRQCVVLDHGTMAVKPTQVERCEAGPLNGEGLQG